MIALSHKSKHYGLIALKVLILGFTFGYIYKKIVSNETLDWKALTNALQSKDNLIYGQLLFFVGLASLNWFLEALKWKTVLSELKKISILTAIKQSLSALTVSLATPNRIGDYGAKALFYPKQDRKKVLLLNFFSNACQMGVTTLFGVLGIVLIIYIYSLEVSFYKIAILLLILLIFGILGYRMKEKQLLLKGLTLKKVATFIKNISGFTRIKIIYLSAFRYVVFSFLFYQLLLFFGADISGNTATPLIMAMYLLVSLVPSIFIFDVVVRGGVAVWLFSLVGIPEWVILSTVFSMWLLNFVLPAILGSFFVAAYKHDLQ